MTKLTEDQIKKLTELAKKQTSIERNPDDWNVYELSGGNYDDCYWIGRDDSDIENARFVLKALSISF